MMRALSIASTGLGSQQLSIEVIANNLANVSTVGFKKSRGEFQDLMYQTLKSAGTATATGTLPVGIQLGSGVIPVSVHRTFAQGDFQQTQNPLDLAIEGDGFFQVTLPDGSTGYSRAGSLSLDSEGSIVTAEGYPLLPNITIPSGAQTVTILPTGVVSAVVTTGAAPQLVGTLELARFTNPAGLHSIGKNLYQATDASGEAVTGAPGEEGFGTVQQGSLEGSNVNIAEEMVNMIVAQRAYELNSKAIQTTDEMLSMVNNLKR
ncbi:flagellar basal-body rod protein FlgG [Candidatus Manganitrophus noduliformans]|uniref:Flagellar basal-body rod protein FlgG n=1 Tax=Candidatus Manganitrophus noduliformans TaxID=2606439 RepID=A0A7X6DTQ6_9BACT|nr:flagellar basal-body rod protein FlgG [Candidatus Manganitrophus noduliformans]NKE73087.1 flagellar basal-body rod protein FlgG [Candidatus Manganitrophus noduliformans]